jgi:hypothetical protein
VNLSKIIPVSLVLVVAGSVHAQLDIQLKDVGLAYPSISAVNIQLGGTTRTGLPTPFVLDDLVSDSLLWFCLDPLQTIYYSGSGRPPGSKLRYESEDPLAFDKWTPLAPGLSNARLQNLADLFHAFTPTATNAVAGGALQIAIWEVVNEFDGSSFSLSGGQMRASSANTTLILTAQGMLDSLDDFGVRNLGDTGSLAFLIDGSYSTGPGSSVLVQDLVGFGNPVFEATAVPESGTFALGIAGLFLSLIAWKLRRRAASGNCLSLPSGEA